MMDHIAQTQDLVLIGGGHSHALVLKRWAMEPLPGARLTLITPEPFAAYSGMLPGFVAGHYPAESLQIDLIRLARAAGARIILGAAQALDPQARRIRVPGRPDVAYDLASIDVGITTRMPDLPGAAEHAIPAKPLETFAARWEQFRAQGGPVAVIGAGVAGAELALAMTHALRQRGHTHAVHLIDRSEILSELGRAAKARMMRALTEARVTLHPNAPVARISAGAVHLASGAQIDAGFITTVAAPCPHPWLAQSGLTHHQGYVTIDPTLRSSDPAVFATGDCAHMEFAPRPKAGVYAVRQAPVLFHNLTAALSGGPMRRYAPQKRYLKLVSMGGKRALAERGGMVVSGAAMWRWKDRIDQTFMDQFRHLSPMRPALPTRRALGADGDQALLCGGCGAKVGRGALSDVLAQLPGGSRADITPLPGDDAALLRTGGAQQVLTTDHLRAVTEDPGLMTRIAAHHALGDIWAMGATPQAATVTVILPRQSPALQRRSLAEIMYTANQVMRESGTQIVGGHSSMGAEMTIGFTLTGLCAAPPITLAGAQPGDVLILTKALGSGTILAAEMALKAPGDVVAACYAQMVQSQAHAAHALRAAHAMTDVTGFGLAGHLSGICAASGVGARLSLDDIPLMLGAERLAAQGVRSSLWQDNRDAVPELQAPDSAKAALLCDPQTAGGLLAAVAPQDAPAALRALRSAGLTAAQIGEITAEPGLRAT